MTKKNSSETPGKKGESSSSEPNVSLNEFARFMVLVRDDERSKNSLMQRAGGVPGRTELDAHVSRNAFWVMIQKRFNDHKTGSCQSYAGYLNDLWSTWRPVSVLKNNFSRGVRP